MIDLREHPLKSMEGLFADWQIPPQRAAQVFSWLYRPGNYDLTQIPHLKKAFVKVIAANSTVSRIQPAKIEESADGTIKYGFTLDDGAVIESVLIPGENRFTLCLSSQVGCAMGCQFCLTAKIGFIRNLTAAEIVNQVIAVMEHMTAKGGHQQSARELINNLVFMGMGEPLANYDNLLTALNILMDERGFEFTRRRVTVSTCGLVPKIKALGQEAQVNLAISLHAADDQTRSLLMPINKTYAIEQLLEACRNFPLSRKKVILFEYLLIEGLNDSEKDAETLAEKLRGIPCRINLMPYNQSKDLPFKCPSDSVVKRFQESLRNAGFIALVRNSRGADISAACGQLAGKIST